MTCIKGNVLLKNRIGSLIRLLVVLPVFLLATSCWAGSVSLVTYFPEPKGVYDRINLIPSTLPASCNPGTLMTESSTGNLKYCSSVGGVGTWGMLSNIWTQAGTAVYPTSTDSNHLISVGIGTSSPEFRLTLENDGGILALGIENEGTIVNYDYLTNTRTNTSPPRFLWYPRKAAFRAVVDSTRITDDGAIGLYSAAFGKDSAARGIASMAAGQGNNTSGDYSLIAGGLNNTASALYAVVTGGQNNTAAGEYAIVSGSNNSASADYSVISGGNGHSITAPYGAIAGGFGNSIAVGGDYSTISGGNNNRVLQSSPPDFTTKYSVIAGGQNNQINNGDYGTIGGGSGNNIFQSYQTVGGGSGNNYLTSSQGNYSVVSGGKSNNAQGNYSVVAGGNTNSAAGNYSAILGGINNLASGDFSVVASGTKNSNYSNYSVIAGGDNNSINGGPYSFVAGRHMSISGSASRIFMWGYSSISMLSAVNDTFIISSGIDSLNPINPKFGLNSTNPSAVFNISSNGSQDYLAITSTAAATAGNIFVIKANGFVGIGNSNPSYPLQIGNITGPQGVLTTGGVWTVTSSRKYKENIHALESQPAIDVLNKLNPVTYNYKINKNENHVGFIAEDVPELVAVENRDSVNMMSITAVLAEVLKKQKNILRIQDDLLKSLEDEAHEISSALRRGGPSKSHP